MHAGENTEESQRRIVNSYRGSVGFDLIVPAAQETKMYLEGIEEDHDDESDEEQERI